MNELFPHKPARFEIWREACWNIKAQAARTLTYQVNMGGARWDEQKSTSKIETTERKLACRTTSQLGAVQ